MIRGPVGVLLAIVLLTTSAVASAQHPGPDASQAAAASPSATSSAPAARTWWVATTGSDLAAGKETTPFATLARALRAAEPGDAIRLGPGRFHGAVIRSAGTRAAPITITGASTAETILDGALDGRRDTVVVRRRAGWLVISDLTVTGSRGSRSAGVLVVGATTGPITLERVRLTGNDGYGALLQNARAVTIADSELDGNATGVEVNGDGADVTISGSNIHDNDRLIRSTPRRVAANDDYGASGVSLVRTTGPVLVTGNRLWGNRAPSPDYGWDGSAFEIFAASGVTIADNVAWDNENLLETGTTDRAPCRGNAFVRNTSWGAATAGRARGIILRCATGMLIANVTLADHDDYALLVGDEGSTFSGSVRGARVTNSLLVQSNDGAPLMTQRGPRAGVTIDHVLLWNDRGPIARVDGHGSTQDIDQLARWLDAPAGLDGSLAAPPRFVDRRARDLRLAPGSPAIDAGTDIPGVTDGSTGTAPDLGALETPDEPEPVSGSSPVPSGRSWTPSSSMSPRASPVASVGP